MVTPSVRYLQTRALNFRCCIRSRSSLLKIWEFHLTATNQNNLFRCIILPTIALTENLSPTPTIDQRKIPWCKPSRACLRPQWHWRSEIPGFWWTVEKSISWWFRKDNPSCVTRRPCRLCTSFLWNVSPCQSWFLRTCKDVMSEDFVLWTSL